jgi:poly(3-hydroxybutyrate) depolymerase
MSFDVALPEGCLGGSCGLIVDIHGGRGSGKDAESHTGMQGLGNAAGYVVVQPSSPGIEWDYPVDSVGIRSFLDQVIEALDIDTDRVHMGGHSAGGYMTWIFVCDHADLIASAAPLGAGASTELDSSCDFDVAGSPSEEVDILLAHGRSDEMVPFDTALAQRDLVVAGWAMTESEVLAVEPTYRWTRWTNLEGTVFEFLEFDWQGGMFGSHCYPGVTAFAGCGSDTQVHYGEAALEFYMAHPKAE